MTAPRLIGVSTLMWSSYTDTKQIYSKYSEKWIYYNLAPTCYAIYYLIAYARLNGHTEIFFNVWLERQGKTKTLILTFEVCVCVCVCVRVCVCVCDMHNK